MKRTKILAVLLSASLVFSQQAVWADEITVIDDTESNIEDIQEVRQVLQSQSEHIEELEEGVDYAERQAFFVADNIKEAEEVANEYGGELESYEEGIAILNFKKSIDDVIKEAADSQSENTKVIYPNYTMELADADTETADPGKKNQWAHDKINDAAAWEYGLKGQGVKVGVLDTGIDTDHEDLKDNIAGTVHYDDADDVEDINGHGSHVSGIIAETYGNGVGGCGIAPEAEIYSVKVGTASSITIAGMMKGVHKAVDAGCKVINISLACATTPDEATISGMQNAIDYAYQKGVTVVVAAGNHSTSGNSYPAALDHVVSVAAITKEGQLASYSNYGDWIDLAAPGSSIYSTYCEGGYKYLSGTSMSAPVVAGAAALIYSSDEKLLSGNDSATADKVRTKLLSASDGETYSYRGRSFAGGCIDLTLLLSDGSKDDSVTPPSTPAGTPGTGGESNPSSGTDEGKGTESENGAESEKTDKNTDGEKGTDGTKEPEKKSDGTNTGEDKTSDPIADDKSGAEGAGDDTTSSNAVRSTIDIGNGASATYYSALAFTGGKLKASDIDMTINHGGESFTVTKFKVKNYKHNGTATVTIRKLSTNNKEIVGLYKGKSFSVQILPRKVIASELLLQYSKSGKLKNVFVYVNGKKHKINKNMYSYDENVGNLTFSGDYVGTIQI